MYEILRHYEWRYVFQWTWKLNGKFKQIGVNKPPLIQVNKDGDKVSERIIHRKYIWKDYQYVVQSSNRS